jgi:hypothetical protein
VVVGKLEDFGVSPAFRRNYLVIFEQGLETVRREPVVVSVVAAVMERIDEDRGADAQSVLS